MQQRRPVCFCNARIYFDEPEELAPEPVLEPMPLLPDAPVLGELVLGELVPGEEVEPLEDDEPLAAPCSCRQRSFSEPVSVSHWVLLLPTEGELEVLPLVLGEVVVLLLEPPLAAEPVLELPLVPCDEESAAIATAEAANSAANVAVESTFNIVASPLGWVQGSAPGTTQAPCRKRCARRVPRYHCGT